MFLRKFKNNVKNEFIRDERKINNLKVLMKITIDFDDWLYEKIIKRKYLKRNFKKIENYINSQIYKNKINSIRTKHKYNYLKTIFIKLNLMMFCKFKQKNAYYSCDKKIISHEIANQKTLFDDNSTLRWKKNLKQKRKKKNEKISITKQSKFHQSILKTKNFTKLINHKIFKKFWIKKNKTAIRQLRKSTQRLTILISPNLCFNDSKYFISIQ